MAHALASLQEQREHALVRHEGLRVGPRLRQDPEKPHGVHEVGVHAAELRPREGALQDRHAVVPYDAVGDEAVNFRAGLVAEQVDDDRLGDHFPPLRSAAIQDQSQQNVRNLQLPQRLAYGRGEVGKEQDGAPHQLVRGLVVPYDGEEDGEYQGDAVRVALRALGDDVRAQGHGGAHQRQVLRRERREDPRQDPDHPGEGLEHALAPYVGVEREVAQEVAGHARELDVPELDQAHRGLYDAPPHRHLDELVLRFGREARRLDREGQAAQGLALAHAAHLWVANDINEPEEADKRRLILVGSPSSHVHLDDFVLHGGLLRRTGAE
mmetsp:Transcript_34994/g.98219  ORF Transcript_34994/g.98219 Transcript_34994/m.98219 type:complete len:324 (-) Transcript_34994:128-1099(-)